MKIHGKLLKNDANFYLLEMSEKEMCTFFKASHYELPPFGKEILCPENSLHKIEEIDTFTYTLLWKIKELTEFLECEIKRFKENEVIE